CSLPGFSTMPVPRGICSNWWASRGEFVARDQAEYEPACTHGSLHRSTDFRFPNPRMVAHRNFYHSISGQRAFEDHLYRPAVRRFFGVESLQHFRAPGAERAEIANVQAIKQTN